MQTTKPTELSITCGTSNQEILLSWNLNAHHHDQTSKYPPTKTVFIQTNKHNKGHAYET